MQSFPTFSSGNALIDPSTHFIKKIIEIFFISQILSKIIFSFFLGASEIYLRYGSYNKAGDLGLKKKLRIFGASQ